MPARLETTPVAYRFTLRSTSPDALALRTVVSNAPTHPAAPGPNVPSRLPATTSLLLYRRVAVWVPSWLISNDRWRTLRPNCTLLSLVPTRALGGAVPFVATTDPSVMGVVFFEATRGTSAAVLSPDVDKVPLPEFPPLPLP